MRISDWSSDVCSSDLLAAMANFGFAARMTFAATVLTLYPEMFPGPLGVSLAGRALAEGKWSLTPIHIRDFATDKHRTVDDTPAGGGAGMVLKADVLAAAIDHAREVVAQNLRSSRAKSRNADGEIGRAHVRTPVPNA